MIIHLDEKSGILKLPRWPCEENGCLHMISCLGVIMMSQDSLNLAQAQYIPNTNPMQCEPTYESAIRTILSMRRCCMRLVS